jgi:uridine phosphorylase
MINVVYRDTPVTLVATRMGIDPTLWILDQLKWCGVEYVVKLGTFVALQWSVKLGDIYAPDTAAVTNPGSVAPYSPSGTNLFRPNTSLRDRIVRTDVGGLVKGGTILTYPWVRAKVRGKSKLPNREYEYDLDKNPDGYFGLEMECAAVFAVAQVLGMKGAAVLVCNRTYRTLLTGEEWTAHTTSESYKQGYAKAVEIAFDAFVNRPTIPAVEGVVRP